MLDALTLTRRLIAFESTSSLSNVDVTREVCGVLDALGFETEWQEWEDARGVRKANVVGCRRPAAAEDASAPGFAWFGHTDTVPAAEWFDESGSPYAAQQIGERLYGRGACDMKGPVACALVAASQFTAEQQTAPLFFGITADEETGMHGAKRMRDESQLFREMVARQTPGVIGEPTLLEVVHGHKGGITMTIRSQGVAGHSATRAGRNANWAMIPFLARMRDLYLMTESDPEWQDERFDPPVLSFNLIVSDNTAAVNITAAETVCRIFIRPMPSRDATPLVEEIERAAGEHNLSFHVDHVGPALWTDPESPFIQELLTLTGSGTSQTVCYGTDGAMLSELNSLAVCGPGSIEQAHTKDEFITLEQLQRGVEVYQTMMRRWCGT